MSVEGNGGVYRAGAKTADGRIWFPNQLGLMAIRTDQDLLRPNISLTPSIRIPDPAHDSALPLTLARNARHLEVELVATALAEPQNVQFRYRMGSDSAWKDVGDQRRLNFQELPPGAHQLEVMAWHVDTDWTRPSAILEFKAAYRLHEHPLFLGTLVALVLLSIVIVWLLVRRRQESLVQAVESRSRQLGDATNRLTLLNQSLNRVDLQHRAALQAVSHELKAAINAALAPLLQNTDKPLPPLKAKQVRVKARTLNALIEQIDRFGEREEDSAKGLSDHDSCPTKPQKQLSSNDSGSALDLEAKVRMEVLLNMTDPEFSVDELANKLGMSRSALYRRISDFHTGKPAELIRELRLEQAARLLTETNQQVFSVAYATGFRNVSTFSLAFTKKTGVSPRQWRTKAHGGRPSRA